MTRFSKQLLLNPSKIWISDIKCNTNNLSNIVSVFECRWMVVAIDSVKKENALLTFMDNQGLKYFVRQRSADCVEISTVIPCALLEDFLEKALHEDPENIFVSNLLHVANSAMYIQHSFEELVTAGISDVFISASVDENALLICMNKSLLPAQEIFKKIRALCFD